MIELHHLTKSYRILGEKKSILSDVDLVLPDRGLICICGKSGSGKSTLLNIIGLQDKADSGSILYNGQDILTYSERAKNQYRRFVIGRISQDYDLVPELSVYHNCELSLGLLSDAEKKDEQIQRGLELVGLGGYEKRKVKELSGGEKQRVAIARAIIGKKVLLLCDEPTGNLDPDTANEVMDHLKRLSKEICVLVVTHNRSIAGKYADRIIDLNNGHITSDRMLVSSIALNEKEVKTDSRIKKKRAVPPKYIFRFAFLNARSHFILSSIIAVFLALIMSLLLTFSYMSAYSREKSLAENLKNQKLYSINVAAMVQQLSNGKPSMDGPITFTEEMREELKNQYPHLKFGDVYTFGRNFYDFSDAKNLENGFYHSIAFTDFIIVDDFDNFSYELVAGTYPKNEGEVLIFDYMAENLLYFSVYNDVTTYEDLLGYTMIDDTSNFSMTISGILRSNFQGFNFVGESYDAFLRDNNYYVANACLSKYRCVFGGLEFAEKLNSGKYVVSHEEAEYTFIKSENGAEKKSSVKKRNARSICVNSEDDAVSKGINILYHEENGYLIRDTILAELLGIECNEITDFPWETLFLNDSKEYDATLFDTVYSTIGNPEFFAYYYSTTLVCSGVFHCDMDDSVTIVDYQNDEWRWMNYTGEYCGPELLLSENVAENADRIAELLPEMHDISFWADDTEKTENVITVFCYFNNILSELDEYLHVNNSLFMRYSWLIAFFMFAAIWVYTAVSIKKNGRTIGILRSVGLSREGVMAIYATSSFALTLISFAISILGAHYLLRMANVILSDGFGINLTVYTFVSEAIKKSFEIVIISSAVALAFVYFWLIIRKPINLIYDRRD